MLSFLFALPEICLFLLSLVLHFGGKKNQCFIYANSSDCIKNGHLRVLLLLIIYIIYSQRNLKLMISCHKTETQTSFKISNEKCWFYLTPPPPTYHRNPILKLPLKIKRCQKVTNSLKHRIGQ